MSTWELIECARVNLNNLGKLVPEINSHPMFKIVEEQLKSASKQAEMEILGGDANE